jgi:hypothetical protein
VIELPYGALPCGYSMIGSISGVIVGGGGSGRPSGFS